MQLLSIRAVLAAAWVLAVCAGGIVGNVNSLPGWSALAAVAVLPPIVAMWRWHDPPQTLSESIREARR
jgi:hypothetical protein